MMKKTLLTIAFIISTVVGFSQNQYHISQNMMYQPFINPSVIGSYSNLNGALFYKNQWTGFEGAPENRRVPAFGCSLELYLDSIRNLTRSRPRASS